MRLPVRVIALLRRRPRCRRASPARRRPAPAPRPGCTATTPSRRSACAVGIERMRGQVEADRLGLEAPAARSAASPAASGRRSASGCRRRRRTGRSGRCRVPRPGRLRAAQDRLGGGEQPARGWRPAGRRRRRATRFSICIRLSWRGSTRAAKSARSANGRSPRAATSACIAAHADLLHRRQRVADGQRAVAVRAPRVKSAPERLMSGGRTRMPHARRLLPQRRQPVGVGRSRGSCRRR